MGLLEKASKAQKKERRGKGGRGLLDQSLPLSEGGGLLEKAQKLREGEDTGSEEGEPQEMSEGEEAVFEEDGAFTEKPLQDFSSGAVLTDMQEGAGLLQKAEKVQKDHMDVDEWQPEEEAPEKKDGLLARATQLHGAGLKEETIEISATAVAVKEKTPAVAVEKKKQAEDSVAAPKRAPAAAPPAEEEALDKVLPAGETEKKKPEKKPAKKVSRRKVSRPKKASQRDKDVSEVLARLFKGQRTMKIMEMADIVIRESGFKGFLQLLTETVTKLGGGKSGVLFLLKNGKYAVECFSPEYIDDSKLLRLNFRPKSKFIGFLKKEPDAYIEVHNLKDRAVQKETAALEAISPWAAISILSGDRLSGFAVVGDLSNRQRKNTGALKLFCRLSAIYMSFYGLEVKLQDKIYQAEKQKDESDAFLELYNSGVKFEEEEEAEGFRAALNNIYSGFGIETAAFLSGWGEKGRLVVRDSIGIPEKVLKHYSISKRDREIKAIIENCEPEIPKDFEKKITKLTKNFDEQFKTFIVVPVVYRGEVLGILIIHKVRGTGKKLTKSMKIKLKHGAQSLLPMLLYEKLVSLNPFEVLEASLSREIKNAKLHRYPLHVILFTFENGKKALGVLGLKKYMDITHRLQATIGEKIRERGAVMGISSCQTVLFTRRLADSEVTTLAERISLEFTRLMKGEKSERAINLAFRILKHTRDFIDIKDLLTAVD
jgi:GAF domain-containing protein